MKALALLPALALLASTHAFAQTASYTIDPAHSSVEFSIRHMAISTVHGRFALKEGTIILDPKDVTKSSVEAVIDVPTVDTGTAQRDTHLKSPDFFDTAKFPIATFHSERITRDGSAYNVVGNLTLHGVTRPLVVPVDVRLTEQWDAHQLIFSASSTMIPAGPRT